MVSGVYYIKQDPAPAGRGNAQPMRTPIRLRLARAVGYAAAPAAGRGGGGAGARRKDRVYAWLPPFDASSKQGNFLQRQSPERCVVQRRRKMMFAAENVNGTGNGLRGVAG